MPIDMADLKNLLGVVKYISGSKRNKKVIYAIIVVPIRGLWPTRTEKIFNQGLVSSHVSSALIESPEAFIGDLCGVHIVTMAEIGVWYFGQKILFCTYILL
ncbi:hypothetical protein Hdeb2414_s0009g00314841 [Helianthus debilis subsp. tardiflorus]